MPAPTPGASRTEMQRRLERDGVAPAVRRFARLDAALASRAGVIFLLDGNGLEIGSALERVHVAGKLAAVHLGLIAGLRSDPVGVRWLVNRGADAVITARGTLVQATRAAGALAIQRLLVIDEASIAAGLHALERAQPDLIEVLPGVLLPEITPYLRKRVERPLLAGGFIRTPADVVRVRAAGALALTTSEESLWP